MEGQRPRVGTERLVKGDQLVRIINGENLFPASLGQAVKGELKRLSEQGGQALGKGAVFRDDPNREGLNMLQ